MVSSLLQQLLIGMLLRKQKYVFAVISLSLLAFSLLFLPQATIAEENENNSSLRKHFKQRWINKKQEQFTATLPAKINKAGNHNFSIVHSGLIRKYRVYVPQVYRASTPASLILAFHGGGGDMNYMAKDKYYGLLSKAESEGFIVVFPNGFSKFKSGKFATWNAGKCCASARDENIDDIGFVRKIIDNVTAQLNIDRRRIYAIGMSNGGMMSYRIACEMADVFKAIASVAGTDNSIACAPEVPISVLHIHARNDDMVLFDGGAGNQFRAKSKVTEFTSVPSTIEKWTNFNKCQTSAQRVLETKGAYCDRYSQCQGNALVQLCVTQYGGHSWPGGNKPRGDEEPTRAILANDVIWQFFQSTWAKSATP